MSEFENNSGPSDHRIRQGQREKAAQFLKERETRRNALYEEMQTERVIDDAKTARLRALRLAKEAEDRASGLNLAKRKT